MEKPILFSGPMVRAILDGKKTVTRRIVKPTMKGATVGCYHDDSGLIELVHVDEDGDPIDAPGPQCPYGLLGGRLWVRESWQIATGLLRGDLGAAVRYRDMEMKSVEMPAEKPMELGLTWDRWRPSIHMPRWASRITLRVENVRIERLMDMTEADAKTEGFDSMAGFQNAWQRMYGAGATYLNPWVWVVSFVRMSDSASV